MSTIVKAINPSVTILGHETNVHSGKKFTQFIIYFEADEGLGSVQVKKRFSDFPPFLTRLQSAFPDHDFSSLPSKKLKKNFDAAFLDKRQAKLQEWCNSILVPHLLETKKFQDLLCEFFAPVDEDLAATALKELTLDDLEPTQVEQVDAVFGKVKDEFPELSKYDCLRFLRAASFDTTNAVDRIIAERKWRQGIKADKLTIADVAPLMRSGKMFPIPGFDNGGRPIFVFRTGLHKPGEFSVLEHIQHYAYVLEYLSNQLSDGESFFFIVDYKDQSVFQNDFPLAKAYLDVTLNYFPDRLGRIICVNSPWFTRVVWNVLYPLMSKELAERISIVGGTTELLGECQASALLKMHGGTLEFNLERWMESRAQAEGVTLPPKGETSKAKVEIDTDIARQLGELPCEEALKGAYKAGYMSKQGGIVKHMQSRYFVLGRDLLFYYKEDTSPAPQGVILLSGASVEDANDSDAGKFFLVTPNRKYVFVAGDAYGKTEWMEALTSAISQNIQVDGEVDTYDH